MILETVRRIGEKMERLSRRNFSLDASLDLLSARARSIEEQIVIEVMREVFIETQFDDGYERQDFANSRSA